MEGMEGHARSSSPSGSFQNIMIITGIYQGERRKAWEILPWGEVCSPPPVREESTRGCFIARQSGCIEQLSSICKSSLSCHHQPGLILKKIFFAVCIYFMLWSKFFKPLSLWRWHQWHCGQTDLGCWPKFRPCAGSCSDKRERPKRVSRLPDSFPSVRTRCSRSCSPPWGPQSRCWPSDPMSCTPPCCCLRLGVRHRRDSLWGCLSSVSRFALEAGRLASPDKNWDRRRGSGCRRNAASESPPVAKIVVAVGFSQEVTTGICIMKNISVLTMMMIMIKALDLNQRLLHLRLPHRAPLRFRAIPGSCLKSIWQWAILKIQFFTKLSDGCWQFPHSHQRQPYSPEIIISLVYTFVLFPLLHIF